MLTGYTRCDSCSSMKSDQRRQQVTHAALPCDTVHLLDQRRWCCATSAGDLITTTVGVQQYIQR
jgi:hypothetical protein